MTKSKIGLMKVVLGEKHFLEIPKGTIDLLQASMKDLREMVDIEQKFAILYSNFIELEEEMAVGAVRDAYQRLESITDMFDYRLLITRRVGNLLSSARLYVDQTKHHISTLFPKDAAKLKEVSDLFSHEYDTRQGYRVMEALRNYGQHRGLPVHGMTHDARWLDDDLPTQRIEYNSALNISTKELEADGTFKPAVMAELTSQGEWIDLKPMVRDYMEGLAAVHVEIRKRLDPRMKQAEELVLQYRKMFEENAGVPDACVGLAAGRLKENGLMEEFFYLTDNPINYLTKLRSRTRTMVNLSKRTASTRIIHKKK